MKKITKTKKEKKYMNIWKSGFSIVVGKFFYIQCGWKLLREEEIKNGIVKL